MQKKSALKWLSDNINGIFLVLAICMVGTVWFIANRYCMKLQSDLNLIDIVSNFLDLLALYFSVVIVLQLSTHLNKQDRKTEFEKSYFITKLQEVYTKILNLTDEVESTSMDLYDTVRNFTRTEKMFKEVLDLIVNSNAIQVNKLDCQTYGNEFFTKLYECQDRLTSTPVRASSATQVNASNSYISIAQDIITVYPQGVAASVKDLDALRGIITKIIMVVNNT